MGWGVIREEVEGNVEVEVESVRGIIRGASERGSRSVKGSNAFIDRLY